jgi:hypothetical protein
LKKIIDVQDVDRVVKLIHELSMLDRVPNYEKKYDKHFDKVRDLIDSMLETQGWVDLYDIMDEWVRPFIKSLIKNLPLNLKDKISDSNLLLRVMEYATTKEFIVQNYNKDEQQNVLHFTKYDIDLWFDRKRNIDA